MKRLNLLLQHGNHLILNLPKQLQIQCLTLHRDLTGLSLSDLEILFDLSLGWNRHEQASSRQVPAHNKLLLSPVLSQSLLGSQVAFLHYIINGGPNQAGVQPRSCFGGYLQAADEGLFLRVS